MFKILMRHLFNFIVATRMIILMLVLLIRFVKIKLKNPNEFNRQQ
jgi:hypothetical protein